jgi:hypothetical protein
MGDNDTTNPHPLAAQRASLPLRRSPSSALVAGRPSAARASTPSHPCATTSHSTDWRSASTSASAALSTALRNLDNAQYAKAVEHLRIDYSDNLADTLTGYKKELTAIEADLASGQLSAYAGTALRSTRNVVAATQAAMKKAFGGGEIAPSLVTADARSGNNTATPAGRIDPEVGSTGTAIRRSLDRAISQT